MLLSENLTTEFKREYTPDTNKEAHPVPIISQEKVYGPKVYTLGRVLLLLRQLKLQYCV